MNRGLLAAIGAYTLWGVIPIFWKQLAVVPALQIMAHRVVWCALLVIVYLVVRDGLAWLRPILKQPRLLGMLAGSAVLIGGNWWLYIWAVNAGHIVETSLGYFINPLISVALGVILLHERMNPRQWVAVALALGGVAYLTLRFGRLPWIALALAASFAAYGLLRKLAHVDSIPGLAIESSLLLLPALAILIGAEWAGVGAFGHSGGTTEGLLLLSGLVTAIPLVWFAYGARRIPLSMIGLLQFIAPTLQLLCGVLIYHEPFTSTHAIGFALIWSALVVYAADGIWRTRMRPAGQVA